MVASGRPCRFIMHCALFLLVYSTVGGSTSGSGSSESEQSADHIHAELLEYARERADLCQPDCAGAVVVGFANMGCELFPRLLCTACAASDAVPAVVVCPDALEIHLDRS